MILKAYSFCIEIKHEVSVSDAINYCFYYFQAWKERKKLQKRLVAAKRKLYELGQQHVFHGFASGEKSQRSSLTEQIIVINTKLFQQALQNIEIFSRR